MTVVASTTVTNMHTVLNCSAVSTFTIHMQHSSHTNTHTHTHTRMRTHIHTRAVQAHTCHQHCCQTLTRTMHSLAQDDVLPYRISWMGNSWSGAPCGDPAAFINSARCWMHYQTQGQSHDERINCRILRRLCLTVGDVCVCVRVCVCVCCLICDTHTSCRTLNDIAYVALAPLFLHVYMCQECT